MFYVIEKTFAPCGTQLDSDSIAEFANLKEADAMVERLTNDRDICPTGADENNSEWYVSAE